MYDGFYCLVKHQVAVTPQLLRKLLEKAQVMARTRESRSHFLTEDATGVVTTVYQHNVMGSIAGIRFDAEVESDLGKGHVAFLVEENHLDETDMSTLRFFRVPQGAWVR